MIAEATRSCGMTIRVQSSIGRAVELVIRQRGWWMVSVDPDRVLPDYLKALAVPGTLTVLWDGEPIGQVCVTSHNAQEQYLHGRLTLSPGWADRLPEIGKARQLFEEFLEGEFATNDTTWPPYETAC